MEALAACRQNIGIESCPQAAPISCAPSCAHKQWNRPYQCCEQYCQPLVPGRRLHRLLQLGLVAMACLLLLAILLALVMVVLIKVTGCAYIAIADVVDETVDALPLFL